MGFQKLQKRFGKGLRAFFTRFARALQISITVVAGVLMLYMIVSSNTRSPGVAKHSDCSVIGIKSARDQAAAEQEAGTLGAGDLSSDLMEQQFYRDACTDYIGAMLLTCECHNQ